jgi:ribonuclease P protein component
MLKKKNRADKKDIDLLFKEGKFVNSPNLTFRFILISGQALPRISFIAPKSVAKLAVKRNKLRRRGYTALGKFIDKFPHGVLGAFIFKTRPTGRSFGREYEVSNIENEIKDILSKIN